MAHCRWASFSTTLLTRSKPHKSANAVPACSAMTSSAGVGGGGWMGISSDTCSMPMAGLYTARVGFGVNRMQGATYWGLRRRRLACMWGVCGKSTKSCWSTCA